MEASHIYCRFGDDHNLDVNLLMDEANAVALRQHWRLPPDDGRAPSRRVSATPARW